MSNAPAASPGGEERSLRVRAASFTLYLFAAAAVSKVVSFVLLGYLARQFDVAGLGAFNLVIAYTTVFGLIADFGVSQYLTREVAARPQEAESLLRRGAVAALILGLAAVLAANLIAVAAGYGPDLRRWIAIASIAMLVGPATIFLALMNARLEGRKVAILGIANQVVGGVLVLAVVLTSQGIQTAIAALTAQTLLYAVSVYVAGGAWRVYRHRWSAGELRGGVGVLARAAPLGAMVVATLIYARIDTFILSVISSAASVGYYTGAYRLAEVLTLVPSAVAATMLPLAGRSAGSGGRDLGPAVAAAFRYLVLLGVPVLIGGLLLARPIIIAVYGDALGPATAAFQILLAGHVSLFFGSVAAAALVGLRHTRQVAITQAIVIPLNVIACLLLIPAHGYLAAAWITLGTEVIGTLYMVAALARVSGTGLRLPADSALRALVGSVPMAGVVGLLDPRAPLGVTIVAGAAVYVGVLVAVRGLSRHDLELVGSLVRPKQ